MYPATLGSLKLTEGPKADGKTIDAKYSSADGGTVRCHGVNASSGEAAYKYATDNAATEKTFTPGKKTMGKAGGGEVWILTWSDGTRGYFCMSEDKNAQSLLNEMDKNWTVGK